MKRALRFILIIALGVLFVSSCGVSTDYVGNLNATEVVLSKANFRVVKNVSATKTTLYVLGIGGSRAAMEKNVVAELTEKANLTGSQALANLTLTRSYTSYGPVWTITVSAYATVVEFEE